MVRGPSVPLAPSLVAAWLLLAPGARADDAAPAPVPTAGPPAPATTPTTPTSPAPTTTPTTAAESSDTAAAREAFRLGSTLAKQAQWLDALAAFRRSAALKPHPITTYNVAYCERALGHYARAYERFRASLEPGALPDAQTLPPDLVAQADAYAAEAERRVARAKVTRTAPDMTIQVDGLPIEPMGARAASTTFLVATDDHELTAPGPSLPASFELWLDPGTHVFIATNPGGERVVESRTLDAGATVALALAPNREATTPTPLPTAAGAPTPSTVLALPAAEGRDAAVTARQGPPDHTPALVAFGAGAAVLVAGTVFAGLALDDKSSLDSDPRCASKHCPDEPYFNDREARMRTFADLATVGLAGGVVGAAVGTYLWVTATHGDASAESHGAVTSRRVAPWVSVNAVGVSGAF